MGKLYEMTPTWFDMSEEERRVFIMRARARMENDLLEPSTFTKKRQDRKTLGDKIAEILSPEEIALAEKMGISKRDLKSTLKL